jgi:SAM-dependent methyltransferase
MGIRGWEERYRAHERPAEDYAVAPVPLVAETAKRLRPGRALDLACGTGRNALWLAKRGWRVTAVDGAPTAIEVLRRRARENGLEVVASVADLEREEYRIEPAAWDLICICYYLQRDLFETVKQGLAPGGIVIAVVHITEAGEEPTRHRLRPGELETYFRGWEILHRYEGQPNDRAHKRPVAEIVARRPDGRALDRVNR